MNKHSALRVQQSEAVIVGAGPAGASLAIRLAAAGHAVTLVEKGRFPREKLCGEFISPECFRHFAELGVDEKMFSLGGARIAQTCFYDIGGRGVSVPTGWFGHGESALSLSRAKMDDSLLSRAKAVGVEVIEGVRVVHARTAGGRIQAVTIKTDDGERSELRGALFVDASGRAQALTRLIEKQGENAPPSRPNLVAFKNHLTGAKIEPDICEIYVFAGGYGGLSPIEGGKANLCFIVKAEVAKRFTTAGGGHIEMVASRNRRAGETLSSAVVAGEWLAVPISSFGRADRRQAENLICIGDAAAFIDPFTGSGMLMALESSEVLAECTRERGLTSTDLAKLYAREHARKFRNRLAASAVLRRAAFMPKLASAAIALTGASDVLRGRLARATRAGSRGPETGA